MLEINNIGADAMIHTRDHQTVYLFDPWDYLGPKRKMLLSESWPSYPFISLPISLQKILGGQPKNYMPPWDL